MTTKYYENPEPLKFKKEGGLTFVWKQNAPKALVEQRMDAVVVKAAAGAEEQVFAGAMIEAPRGHDDYEQQVDLPAKTLGGLDTTVGYAAHVGSIAFEKALATRCTIPSRATLVESDVVGIYIPEVSVAPAIA